MVNLLCPECLNWFHVRVPLDKFYEIIEDNNKFIIYRIICPICNNNFKSKWKKQEEVII
jgi:hypothetical protein